MPSFGPAARARLLKTLEAEPLFAAHAPGVRQMLEHAGRFEASQAFSATVTMTGDFTYDSLNGRQRIDVKTFKMVAPGLPSDTITTTGENFEILRFDLGKNLTKVQFENGGKCVCNDLKGEIDPYYVPPAAVSAGTESVTIGTTPMTLNKYVLNFDMGGMVSANLTVYTGQTAPNYAMKCIVSFSASGMQTTVTQVFTNPTSLDNLAATVFTPTDCTCPTIPPPAAIPAAAKALTCGSGNPPAGCICPTAANKADMPFCGAIVTYPIDPLISVATTDAFVKTAYDMAGGADCTGLKEFLCNFYFQICSANKDLFAPEKAPTCAAATKTSAYARYESGIKTTGTSGKSSAATLAIATASLLLAALAILL
jgi:hypothetical protein